VLNKPIVIVNRGENKAKLRKEKTVFREINRVYDPKSLQLTMNVLSQNRPAA